MYLACTTLGMTLEQAITAATINAAYSIGLSHRVGAITEGRQGDFVVINTRRFVQPLHASVFDSFGALPPLCEEPSW